MLRGTEFIPVYSFPAQKRLRLETAAVLTSKLWQWVTL